MKLIFYKTVQGPDGKPIGHRVMTVEDAGSRRAVHVDGVPALRMPLSHWRQFADFFEIT
ncbi:MAG: hypothetical protein JO021_22025 [Alphaproteobacteria bacterium]|nr:hypothetical protein [Alphaproteobacteria bacterium]